jgi:hypothetical protein
MRVTVEDKSIGAEHCMITRETVLVLAEPVAPVMAVAVLD